MSRTLARMVLHASVCTGVIPSMPSSSSSSSSSNSSSSDSSSYLLRLPPLAWRFIIFTFRLLRPPPPPPPPRSLRLRLHPSRLFQGDSRSPAAASSYSSSSKSSSSSSPYVVTDGSCSPCHRMTSPSRNERSIHVPRRSEHYPSLMTWRALTVSPYPYERFCLGREDVRGGPLYSSASSSTNRLLSVKRAPRRKVVDNKHSNRDRIMT